MFAELESWLSGEFSALANGAESISVKLQKASGLSTTATSLDSIQADTTTSTEAKILAAYNLGKTDGAATVTTTAATTTV